MYRDFHKNIFYTIMQSRLWGLKWQNSRSTFANNEFDNHDCIWYTLNIKHYLNSLFGHKIATSPKSLFPTQNILYLESFPLTVLVDTALYLTSCKPPMFTSRQDITWTISLDWALIFPTFYEHILKFRCDNWPTIC